MKVIQPSFDILYPKTPEEGVDILRDIEWAARTCYKSEDKITGASHLFMIRNLIKHGHEAMLEHGQDITVRFIVDRGVSHELVRHRLASFAQESTRYCNYSQDKFGGELTFISPPDLTDIQRYLWHLAMGDAEKTYLKMLGEGATPQIARGVLPTSLKTELIMKANVREWRHIFALRCAKAAHPQMRQIMLPLREALRTLVPVVFDE